MIRTQVQLTEKQSENLKQLAGRRGVSMAELVRQAVEQIIEDNCDNDKWERARAMLGRYHSGLTDLGKRHDDYLAEDFW